MKKQQTLDTKIETFSVEGKVWYKSKTLWLGVVKIVLGIALAVCDQMLAGEVLTLAGIATIALRFLTTQAITLKTCKCK